MKKVFKQFNNVRLNPFGFGAQRIGLSNINHKQSLKKALLEANCNFIDTAASYTNGQSEFLIGEVLKELCEEQNSIQREKIIISTKLGCLQGQQLQFIKQNHPNLLKEGIQFSDNFVSCIHPDYLHFELLQSIKRLNGFKPNIVLLHNPEYFFSNSLKVAKQKNEQEFYELKIAQAFEFLEQQVKEGNIQAYGISTNTENCKFSVTGKNQLQKDISQNEATSIEKLVSSAKKASQKIWNDQNAHNFKFLQIPFNLIESNPLSDIQKAQDNGLYVVINRPLNAIAPVGFGASDWGRNSSYFKIMENRPIIPEQALLRNIIREKLGPETFQYELQQLALWICNSQKNIDVVLSGARQPKYIEDIIKIKDLELIDEEKCQIIFEEINKMVQEYEQSNMW